MEGKYASGSYDWDEDGDIEADALALYNQKIQFPEDKVSQRCLDFKDLKM